MLIHEFLDQGLGNTAYLVASEAGGAAAVIDPQRDVDRYVRVADGLGLRLLYALDTHLHNDFISGVRELALRPGVQIGASAKARLGFDHTPLRDGDALSLGEISIGVLDTPGHTPEHISFTLTEAGRVEPLAVFTGGALMVGGAARTDLLGPLWTTELAKMLYQTLHGKLLKLGDAVRVYPTHGAGSFCAAPGAAERTTTIGRERATNYLLQAAGVDEFVTLAATGLPSYPAYFREMRAINQRGPALLGRLPELPALSAAQVQSLQQHGAAIVDLRPVAEFAAGHVPGSHSVALRDAFGTWVGWVVPFGTPIILVSHEAAREHETATRQLIRIGYDKLLGYMAGGLPAWQEAAQPLAHWRVVTPAEVRARQAKDERTRVVDVRQAHEWQAGHIPGALHVEAGDIPRTPLALAADQPLAVHCGHHDRAATALALLEQRGFKDLMLLDGGVDAWRAAGYEIEAGDNG